MSGHGAGSSKRNGASRVQLQLSAEVQVLANLGDDPMSFSNSSNSNSTSSTSSNLGEADSEGDAEVDSHAVPTAGLTMDVAGPRYMYSPLDGGSDSDSELGLDDVELFCEEALALLAHEMVCCDCDSDIESQEEDGEEESESEMDTGSDQVAGYGQDNLSHSAYQLMFSEEDEEEPVGNAKKKECPYVVESVLLLDEEQESDEISDPKSGDSLVNATPG